MRLAKQVMCLTILVGAAPRAAPADIVNGWSQITRITTIYSIYSYTMFKLANTADSCGHPDYWQLPLTETAASKTKNALILAAFISGKQVSIRCENGVVSDFQVFE